MADFAIGGKTASILRGQEPWPAASTAAPVYADTARCDAARPGARSGLGEVAKCALLEAQRDAAKRLRRAQPRLPRSAIRVLAQAVEAARAKARIVSPTSARAARAGS